MQTAQNTPTAPQNLAISKKGARYQPTAQNMHNTARTWQFIQTTLAAGPHTVASLTAAVATQYNHASFIKYAIRSQWLQLVNAPAPTKAATKAAK